MALERVHIIRRRLLRERPQPDVISTKKNVMRYLSALRKSYSSMVTASLGGGCIFCVRKIARVSSLYQLQKSMVAIIV